MNNLENLDTREWLLTNGLGGFASGTVSDVRTRTYHGWLFAAKNPPSGRVLLLSHLQASLELPGRTISLGSNYWGTGEIEADGQQYLREFVTNPSPRWIWGEDDWSLSRSFILPNMRDHPHQGQRLLVQYCYEGVTGGVLYLRVLIADRDFHHQQLQVEQLRFSQLQTDHQVAFQAINGGKFGTPWYLRWSQGEYHADGIWYWNYGLLAETERGLGDREHLYSPGYLSVELEPGDKITLEARVGIPMDTNQTLSHDVFTDALETEQNRLEGIFPGSHSRLWSDLLRASDQFIVYRASIAGTSVIAGYHWFNDWGRDTLIALPGLTLTTQRYDLAKGLLRTFARYCRYGLIPNGFPDEDNEPFYNSIDAALWWVESLGLYLQATRDWDFLLEQYPTFLQIYKAFVGGTRYHIQVDSTDGLVSWDNRGFALTWMDAVVDGQPVTPRWGKPVEINALWYSVLCWASRWAEILSEYDHPENSARYGKQARRYSQQAEQVRISLQKYWHPQQNYLYDTIELDDRRNTQIRPNAVIALSLTHCAFPHPQARQILEVARNHLLTPYGLRSLSPTDPEYIGIYQGNPKQRDRAYHQGTVWCWLIGPFIRSWQRFYPHQPLPFDWQPLIDHFYHSQCIGSISEIFDGDFPHHPKGAIAQAWSVAEVMRHLEEQG